MTRLVWLQYKITAVVVAAALLVVAVMLGVTGEHLLAVYRSMVGACQGSHDCSLADNAFQSTDNHLAQFLNYVVVVVPALIGLFWAAPLVSRELETGAFRLAWTQSVTRTRWLAVKLAAAGLAGMAVAGLVSLMVTWWWDPIAKVNLTLWANFDQRDVVPIGYAALGFMLGVTAGLIFRRTLPAMATSLVVFVAARLSADHWLRPLLLFRPSSSMLRSARAPSTASDKRTAPRRSCSQAARNFPTAGSIPSTSSTGPGSHSAR